MSVTQQLVWLQLICAYCWDYVQLFGTKLLLLVGRGCEAFSVGWYGSHHHIKLFHCIHQIHWFDLFCSKDNVPSAIYHYTTMSTTSTGLTFLHQKQCPHHHIPLFHCVHCVPLSHLCVILTQPDILVKCMIISLVYWKVVISFPLWQGNIIFLLPAYDLFLSFLRYQNKSCMKLIWFSGDRYFFSNDFDEMSVKHITKELIKLFINLFCDKSAWDDDICKIFITNPIQFFILNYFNNKNAFQ